MTEPISRFPLQWPVGWKRTADSQRQRGNFSKRTTGASNYSHLADVTVSEAIMRLLKELERFGIPEYNIVVSTNVALRLDGLPRSGQAEPGDPGAAVYWRDGGQDRCMAIDRYSKVAQNIAALAATIDAMRAIERHGGATVLDRAFTGFTALPAPIVAGMKRSWWVVLDCSPNSGRSVVEHAYKRLASKYHPDREGGDAAKMAELNAARDEALKECTP